jgi:hypothetical protein
MKNTRGTYVQTLSTETRHGFNENHRRHPSTSIDHDDIPHTVLSVEKATIVSPALDARGNFSYTFALAGTNNCCCSAHLHMKGRIIVESGKSSR